MSEGILQGSSYQALYLEDSGCVKMRLFSLRAMILVNIVGIVALIFFLLVNCLARCLRLVVLFFVFVFFIRCIFLIRVSSITICFAPLLFCFFGEFNQFKSWLARHTLDNEEHIVGRQVLCNITHRLTIPVLLQIKMQPSVWQHELQRVEVNKPIAEIHGRDICWRNRKFFAVRLLPQPGCPR